VTEDEVLAACPLVMLQDLTDMRSNDTSDGAASYIMTVDAKGAPCLITCDVTSGLFLITGKLNWRCWR
jgi:hypothetical protein